MRPERDRTGKLHGVNRQWTLIKKTGNLQLSINRDQEQDIEAAEGWGKNGKDYIRIYGGSWLGL